ncbi:MAG: peroxidase-related enzyme [Pseudomonadota bacterium]
MPYIKTIFAEEATGRLKELYTRIKGPDGRIDNILTAHSLRPASLEGHMALYKNVLHHNTNTTPKWFLETIGVFVSLMNVCNYCVDHHFEGLKRLLADNRKANAIRNDLEKAVASGSLESASLSKKEIDALLYAMILTKTPHLIKQSHIDALRKAGWEDGEILEINQVVAYFAYANRTVLGLGVTTDGDVLGLSPSNSDDETDWGHQ